MTTTTIPIQVESNQDISLYYAVNGYFDAVGATGVNYVQGYPDNELVKDDLPLIAITDSTISVSELELGNERGMDLRTWFIDVYALQYDQARDFAYFIKRNLQDSIRVYDFNESAGGFPATGTLPTEDTNSALGYIRWKRIDVQPIPVNGNLVSTMYYRRRVILRSDFSQPLT